MPPTMHSTEGAGEKIFPKTRIYEVRWHGRGGQGAVTAAQILAEAAYLQGYHGVTAAPSFGAERRGVPVSAFTRFSLEPIRVYSQVDTPDVVVVLDHTLLKDDEVISGLRREGWLVVNSWRRPEELGVKGNLNIATADATRVCRDLGLIVAGLIIVNTAILGAFARATKMVELASIEKVIRERFSDATSGLNLKAIRMTYEITNFEEMRR